VSDRVAGLPTLLALVLLATTVPLACWMALGLGPSPAGWSDLADAVLGRADPGVQSIVLSVRLPRVVLAALVGAALSAAGVAFQAVLRNPLADPFILGVSGGAALGAVMFVTLARDLAWSFPLGRPLAAFAGSVATLAVLFLVARVRGRTGATTLLLVGVVLNAIDSAVILFVVTAGDPGLFQGALDFLVGSVRPRAWSELAATAAFVGAGVVFLALHAHRMNLLAFGEEVAGQLGVEVERTVWTLVLASSLVTAAAVAFTGLVGFVGLIVPHALRTLLGVDHRVLVPASALGGAAFLVLADALARTVVAPVDLPVGVITTLAGGPLFLVLFLRHLRSEG
jgi:iron complex transport system permease protein